MSELFERLRRAQAVKDPQMPADLFTLDFAARESDRAWNEALLAVQNDALRQAKEPGLTEKQLYALGFAAGLAAKFKR